MSDNVVLDINAPSGSLFVMPTDIVELISQAQLGLLSWDFVNKEVEQAIKDGRIGAINNIG